MSSSTSVSSTRRPRQQTGRLEVEQGGRDLLVGQTDAAALTELSETLCHITLAPRETVRKLAFHNDPSVAVPAAAELKPAGRRRI